MLKKGGKQLEDKKNVEEWEDEQTWHFKYICRIALLRDSRNKHE